MHVSTNSSKHAKGYWTSGFTTSFSENENSMVRKLKTSDFFEGNIRTFDAKHPYFQSKKSVVLQLPDRRLSPPKIFFPKISYTSYTRAPKPLFLQGISGEG